MRHLRLPVSICLILILCLTMVSAGTVFAASTSSTDSGSSGGILSGILNFLFNKILGPVLHLLTPGTNAPTSGNIPKPPNSSTGSTGSTSGQLLGKVIVVDPGHGGGNPGAVGPNGEREADINLAVGLKLRSLLQNAGAKVIMTRTSDTFVASPGSSLGQELQARLDIADANRADIFVSLHSNSNEDPSIEGAMTFFPAGKSSTLADSIQQELIKTTKAQNKGVNSATFYVLRNSNRPATLVEMGFVSNPNEAQALMNDSYRQQLAQGVFNGIASYFRSN